MQNASLLGKCSMFHGGSCWKKAKYLAPGEMRTISRYSDAREQSERSRKSVCETFPWKLRQPTWKDTRLNEVRPADSKRQVETLFPTNFLL